MKWLTAILAVGVLCMPAWGTVTINEIRIDQTSTDNDEYFELAGDPSESLSGLTYLVIGDGSGSGTIECVVDLTGYSIPADGHFLVVEETFSLVPQTEADIVLSGNGLNFENSDNVTHLLVSGFTGSNGDDLDTNDDGVLDVTPWTSIVDLIALILEDNPPSSTEYHYGPPTVGPDGTYVPGHVYVLSGTWTIGPFNPSGGDDTPGSANGVVVAVDGATLTQKNTYGVTVKLKGDLGNPYSSGRYDYIIQSPGLSASYGVLKDNGTPITTYPYTVAYNHTLTYDPPSTTYRGSPSIEFKARDEDLEESVETALHHILVQDNVVAITEFSHYPFDWNDQFEYVELYYYGAGDPITLWAVAGNLWDDTETPETNASGNMGGESAKVISAGEAMLIAPKNTAADDYEFACDWSLAESDITRVDQDSWEGIDAFDSLLAVYSSPVCNITGDACTDTCTQGYCEDTHADCNTNTDCGAADCLFDQVCEPALLDAVWLVEDASWHSSCNPFERGHSVAWNPTYLWNENISSGNNDGGIPPQNLRWQAQGSGGDFYATGMWESARVGNFGSPLYVPGTGGPLNTPTLDPCYYACCLPDGGCADYDEAECDAACGTWYGGTEETCDDDPGCTPAITGACCTPYGDCLLLSECECADPSYGLPGAVYKGDGTDCDVNTCGGPVTVSINEFDYDQESTDYFEYIELMGPAGSSLDGWYLELVNGNDGMVYKSIDLTGLSFAADDRFLVIGSEFVPNVDLEFDAQSNNIQNGVPDGIVLCNGSTPVDMLSYGDELGLFAEDGCASGQTLPDIGVEDSSSARRQLQKVPSGYDWTETLIGTPGSTNYATGACCDGNTCGITTPWDCEAAGHSFMGPGVPCSPDPCTDKGCHTLAEARALGTGVGVLICDAVVSTTTDLVSSTNSKNVHIQDATGGIAVYGINATIDGLGLSEGDVIDIYGTTDAYNGLLELTDDQYGVTLVVDSSTNGTPPAPQAIQVEDIMDGVNAEAIESTLVTLECVIFDEAGGMFSSGDNYTVSNDGGVTTAQVRVTTSDLGMDGQTIPSGYVNVTGILGQYTYGAPYDGYQLQPRGMADISTSGCTSPPTGACCDGSSCSEISYLACANSNGVYMGNGSTCTPNPCVTGACCPILGGCLDDYLYSECEVIGGNWVEGAVCSSNPCPDPLGACCLPGGNCALLTEDECVNFYCGTWNAGVDCSSVSCDANTNVGCCALPYEAKVKITECECTLAGGNFDGDDVTPDCAMTPYPGTPNPLVINEIRIDQTGGDDDEYFELFGDAGIDLYGLSYVVIGDATTDGAGRVEEVLPLFNQAIPADGFFLAVEDTFSLVPQTEADMVLSGNGLNFENLDNVTHMLVFGFSGAVGDDLDTDNDGTLDIQPWADLGVIDCLAVIDDTSTNGDAYYCGDTIGPVGATSPAPGHVYMLPDNGVWMMGEMDPSDPLATDTPGTSNSPSSVMITGVDSCRTHDPSGAAVEVCFALGTGTTGARTTHGDNIEMRAGGVLKLVLTLDGDAPSAGAMTASANCSPTAYTGTVSAQGQSPASNQVTVTFDPALPDECCCEIAVDGLANTWYVGTLAGDANQDGDVTSLDYSYIKLRLGNNGTASPKADVNTDNDVTSLDYSTIKLRLGHVIPNPCP